MSIDTKHPNCKDSLLDCAVKANSLECVKLFIEKDADVNSLEPSGTNAIHLAAYLGYAECLEALLNASDADTDIQICIRGKETALHLAAHRGCVDCVNLLLAKGADYNLKNEWGHTALHFAARKSNLDCVKLLLTKGNADPNDEDFYHRTPVHVAVAKSEHAFNILETLISWGANVNHQDTYGYTGLHLAAHDGLARCVEALLNAPGADPDIKICIRGKETALHLAADKGNVECVSLLLAEGADSNLKNDWGHTALHFAARKSSLVCVMVLLMNGNADPNAEDIDGRTPLHAAVGKFAHACLILETLISKRAKVNHKDNNGFTALHLAAIDGLAWCVEMLISSGADVTIKTKSGATALNFIIRQTPVSVAMIRHKIDAAITLLPSQDVELKLNFRELLQHSHPHEISYLNTFVDEGQTDILEHPLCSAFLCIKWGNIRKYYYGHLVFCFIFVLIPTLYVLPSLTQNCDGNNGIKDDSTTTQAQEICEESNGLFWILGFITILEFFRKLCGMTGYSSIRQYVTQMENILEWIVILSVFVILVYDIHTKQTHTFRYILGAFAVLLGWINLMLMIGQLPFLNVYIKMYTTVQREFAKLFMAYFCMIVGFTINFCVIFPSSSSFSNPFMGFVTVLVMMSGEQDLSLLTDGSDGKDPPILLKIYRIITFVLFLVFVTIILMNLLVSIAVHDIQGLKKTAELSKLVRQTQLIYYIESALFALSDLFDKYLTAWLGNLLHYKACEKELCVKPLNPNEKGLPRAILMTAHEVAKEPKLCGRTITAPRSEAVNFSDNDKHNNNSPHSSTLRIPERTILDASEFRTVTTENDNAKRIEALTIEIQELKQLQQQASKNINKILSVISNQQRNNC